MAVSHALRRLNFVITLKEEIDVSGLQKVNRKGGHQSSRRVGLIEGREKLKRNFTAKVYLPTML